MRYRLLGSSGLVVSHLALGTMTFGVSDWGCDEREAHGIVKRYFDGGGNFIDSADVYAGGKAEEIIGHILPALPRDRIILASKCYFPMGDAPNAYGLSRKHIMDSCESSLRRLKTDYIDLYYIHGPDPLTPLEETMRALDDLVRQGKIRYLGCSNIFGWQIAKANGIAERMNLGKLIAGQYLYNLIHRELEREVIPAAVDQGLGIIVYSPLGGGLLTGKYQGMSEPAKGTRLAFRTQVDGPRFWHPRGFKTVEILKEVSNTFEIPMPKLAIAWPLKRKFVSSVVLGVKNQQQLDTNLEIGDWDMPEEIWKVLEEKTRPEVEYLNWFSKKNYERFFATVEFHDEKADLP